MKPRIFLSYSRADKRFVEMIAASLDERGFVTDWDQFSADPSDASRGIAAEDAW